jgi:hypothetical protein
MEASPSSPPDSAEAERDALRIQAAAVAAQQVALALEEERLRQKAAALERQEAQLASHLEERRQKLLDLQEQVRKDREALKADRTAAEAERAELRASLQKEHAELRTAGEAAGKERQRFVGLRKRLRQRWRRHWDVRETDLKRREAALSGRRAEIAADAAGLQREREVLSQARMRFNGEAELGRRKLQEAWEELALTQQEWDACLNQENASRERRTKELDEREAALAAAEKALAERERLWTKRQAGLVQEIEGLETRIRNQRAQLAPAPDTDTLFPPLLAPANSSPPTPAPGPTVPGAIEELTVELDDQRRHLLEQWAQLLSVQGRWECERLTLLEDLDAAAGRLDERERRLRGQEIDLADQLAALRRRQEANERARSELEGRRARLAAREAARENEHAALVAEASARGESAEREASRLQGLKQRWGERRREELEELKGVRARCEETRAGYLKLWQECQTRQAAVIRQQRDVSTQALALERLRRELLSRAPDAASAERRLAKLEQRNQARLEAGERNLVKAREALLAETARLSAEWKRFQEEETALLARQEELNQQIESYGRTKAEEESDAQRRRDELRRLREGHARDARELAALREEVELIAHHLLDDGQIDLRDDERQAA